KWTRALLAGVVLLLLLTAALWSAVGEPIDSTTAGAPQAAAGDWAGSPQVVSPGGVWTWFNDPRAVYDPDTDTLFFAGLRSNGRIFVQSWDFTRQRRESGTPRTAVLQVDDHANPALIILDDGTIGIAYTQHNGGSFFARSSQPKDIRTWQTPVTIATSPNETYNHLFQMGDSAQTLYRFFRFERGAPPAWHPHFQTSTDRGATWGPPTKYLQSPG